MNTELSNAIRDVHKIFKDKGLSLSVAESCTGGLLSHYLTYLPGSSSFFIAGVISYSESAKIEILGISSETISRYGVISKETAEEMARRIRTITGSDYSVSTTGNLGPDVLEGKDRGLVYIAVSNKETTITRELRLSGDRGSNKEDASLSALRLLIEVVNSS